MIALQDLSLSRLANFPANFNWVDGTLTQIMRTPNYVKKFDKSVICFNCGELGHKSTYCQEQKMPQEQISSIVEQNPEISTVILRVICFYCKENGHYADKCPYKT